jgi:hypothetical protein
MFSSYLFLPFRNDLVRFVDVIIGIGDIVEVVGVVVVAIASSSTTQ